MIQLTRLNKTAIVLNSDLIEHMEVTPDTVICLTTGQKIRVLESADEVIRRVLEWRQLILFAAPPVTLRVPPEAQAKATQLIEKEVGGCDGVSS